MLQKYQVLTTNAMCHPGWDAKQKGKAVAGAITKSQVGSMDEIVLISTVYQCLFPYFKWCIINIHLTGVCPQF